MRYITLITFLSFLLVGCASADKAMYKTTSSISNVDRVTGERTLNLQEREQQIKKSNKIGKKVIKKYESEDKPINAELDSKKYKRLKEVFQKVHSVSHLDDEDWHVYLLPDKSFNAYVLGGTQVFVHIGLFKTIKSNDELAAVMGHEIAHVTANHVYEQRAHKMAATLKGSDSVKEESFQNAFTHKAEREADEIGILYAALAGYEPAAAANLWKRLYKEKGNQSLMVRTHPNYERRYNYAKKLADKYAVYHFDGKVNNDYEYVLRNNPVFGKGSENMANPDPGEGGGFLSFLETTANTFEKHYDAKAERMRQKVNIRETQYIKKTLKTTEIEKIGSQKLRASFKYTGNTRIKSLTIKALSNSHKQTQIIDKPIRPKEELSLVFDFKKTLTQRELDSIRFLVTSGDLKSAI